MPCGFCLQVGSRTVSEVFSLSTRGINNEYHSQYTRLVTQINSGQRLQMHGRHGCYIDRYYSDSSFLGVFYLPFQAGPAIHLNGTTSTMTFYTGTLMNIFGRKYLYARRTYVVNVEFCAVRE